VTSPSSEVGAVDVVEALDGLLSSFEVEERLEASDVFRTDGDAVDFGAAGVLGFLKSPFREPRGFSGRAATVFDTILPTVGTPSKVRFSGLGVRERDGGFASGADMREPPNDVLDDTDLRVAEVGILPLVGVPSIGVSGALNVLVDARKLSTASSRPELEPGRLWGRVELSDW